MTNNKAETLLKLWMGSVFGKGGSDCLCDVRFQVKELHRRSRLWMQKELKYMLKNANMVLAWTHTDVFRVFSDDPFDPRVAHTQLSAGTFELLDGVLSTLHGIASSHVYGIPLPMVYDRLAREVTRRVLSAWIECKKLTSMQSKHKLLAYFEQLTHCISTYALGEHSEFAVTAIELAILTLICSCLNFNSVSPLEPLQRTACVDCVQSAQQKVLHTKFTVLIRKIYQAHEDVTLQSISDSPQSSPLSAMSAEGLDLGHTFLLVAKLMRWHDLPLPEAQALAVCSGWMAATDMPCTADFFKRMSSMQADAESRALQSLRLLDGDSSFVYDDVVDAWVAAESRQPKKDMLQANNDPCFRFQWQGGSTKRKRLSGGLASSLNETQVEEDDEIDFLRNTQNLHSSRICRRVQRLDVAQEATRFQRQARRSHETPLLSYL